ncbi:MmgE/PrpD family protein [Bordetella sp. BOR01]|uniref:MmgE/PrpD family protein n=1 Tax=Bordetella sp. BOR01 TaxID=2854779 RepID=UPI001C4688E8|nr:MmgE/PrpD family protein [Bordetella sp. BOR01]MBV7482212.1 MmgE/PrpD family protein [Bordetella sp. BOR01]
MVTEQFSRFVLETPARQIPAPVLQGARDAFIDTVGVALAGLDEPASRLATRWVEELGARPQASLFGATLATAPTEAAFANGISAHALDLDDSLTTLHGHPSATLVPAALAVAQSTHASGAELLAAYALGLEVAGKFGRALGDEHYMRGWHSTSTIGVFSCTAAAARLWGLDAKQLCMAWGLAASQMSGLLRNFGFMAKPFHAGHAARAGVWSAWAAKAGMTADPDILDGTRSMLATYGGGDGATPSTLVGRLGAPWEILDPGINVKRWPCCYGTHRGIAGLLALREAHGLRADDVQSVEVGFVPGNDAALIGREPATGLEAKFSMEYTAAAALIDGAIGVDTFTDAAVMREPHRALMRKVRRYHVDPRDIPAGMPVFVDLAVTIASGRLTLRVQHAPGSRAAPMDAQDRKAKFLECAGRWLDPQRAQALHALLWNCADLADADALMRATRRRSSGEA